MSTPERPEARKISRRQLLLTLAIPIGVGTLAGAGSTLLEEPPSAIELQKIAEQKAARQRIELDRVQRLETEFKEGLSKKWGKANVWPGLMVVPRTVQLFTTPDLRAGTEILWPSDRNDYHLLIQRPFFSSETARANSLTDLPNMGPEIMAFWLPKSNDLAFFDRYANKSEVVAATSYTGGVYRETAQEPHEYLGLVGEDITLEPALIRDGLVYRYLDSTSTSYDYEGYPDVITLEKVCGRSDWGSTGEIAYVLNDFETGEGPDLVELPRRTRS